MASAKGCFRNGCLGCLGLIVLVVIVVGIISLVAWKDSRHTLPVDTVLAPEDPAAMPGNALFRRGGTVRLNLSEGEFYLKPAAPGEGLQVDAVYDDAMFDLEQSFTVLPDSTWEYSLDFQQTETGMRAFLRSLFSKGPGTKLTVRLPRDIPIDLETRVSKGGLEGELGGLWVRRADLEANMGGFALEISEPLAQPMQSLNIRAGMGGFEARELGNASPAELDIRCRMGGAEVDMSGAWLNDCRARFEVDMGGMEVGVPADVELIDGWPTGQLEGQQEVGARAPILYFEKHEKRGEIEFTR
jgi:hypothetical protein